jgi:hypothetical protein
MQEKVGAVYVGNAALGRCSARVELSVKQHGLAADPGHEVHAPFALEPWRVGSIYVVQNWAVGLEGVVIGLVIAKNAVCADPEAVG